MDGAESTADPGGAPTPDPADPCGAPTVDAEALRRWVTAFCIIRFDLERGQVVEKSFPDPPSLPPEKLRVAAFSSFPDSMSHHLPQNRSSLHDSLFSFRLNNSASNSQSKDSSFLYGFVFNRQRQDPRLPRGGEQKSVVILTHLPFLALFKLLLQILGPLCFDIGHSALSLVAGHVAAWPDPVVGQPMELPIGNASLKIHLPPSPESPSPPSNLAIPHGLFHSADLFQSFRGIILRLWDLWELVLIGSPILLIAPTPSQCSEGILSLVSLIAPIPCNSDFRPYFTIHDPDFSKLNSLPNSSSFPSVLLGVTNLFFLKSLKNIPTIISIGNPNPNSTRTLQTNPKSNQISQFSPTKFFNNMKLKREGPLCLMTEHKEAVWSTYNGSTKPDTAVLNRLVDTGLGFRVSESGSVVNNEILRRHFLELTINFLAPFSEYFRAKNPSESLSPYVEAPAGELGFGKEEFLEGLRNRGPGKFLAKRMRNNWLDLYKRFLEGNNFTPWFKKRRENMQKEQERIWRQARMNCDIIKLMSKMSELEKVDLFNAIERFFLREIEIQNSETGTKESVPMIEKMKRDLRTVFDALPKDTQELLLSNPKRASHFLDLS
ncbi:hypothetical protein LUZ60_006134 [Juncus effusus]|nr:hypothetical protein LUZ60_006134 [Juncus effusus]